MKEIYFQPGEKVVVVEPYDSTLPESFVGRTGVVVRQMSYQGLGDDADVDPLILVEHGPAYGESPQTQIYWREEISKL